MRSRFMLVVIILALAATLACSGNGNPTNAPTANVVTGGAAAHAATSSSTSNQSTSSTASPGPSTTSAAAMTGPSDMTLSLSRPSRSGREATASVVQVTMGDDPGDRVASLSLIINSVTLTSDKGTTVTLISSPTTLEISSLAGTTTPIGTVTVPAGTYTKATIALGGATITIVDPNSNTTVQKTFPAPANPFTITLNPAFVSTGTSWVINLDLDLHQSVAFDSAGNILFNPIFLATHGAMGGKGTGIGPNPFTGGVEKTFGVVSAVNAPKFTITTVVGQRSLTFNTDSSTIFKNVSGISGLQKGMLVMVAGQAQSDGSWSLTVCPTGSGESGSCRRLLEHP